MSFDWTQHTAMLLAFILCPEIEFSTHATIEVISMKMMPLDQCKYRILSNLTRLKRAFVGF